MLLRLWRESAPLASSKVGPARSLDSRTVTSRTAAVLAFVAAAACAGQSRSGPPASSATGSAGQDEPVAEGLREHHRHHHHGGLILLVALSLDTLGVPPEERTTLDGLRSDLHAVMDSARAAEAELYTELADGVASGAVDAGQLDAAVARVGRAAGETHKAAVPLLGRVHAALSPTERAALADKIVAHWEVWVQANGAAAPMLSESGDNGRLAALAAEVGLTQRQIDDIRGRLANVPESKRSIDIREVDPQVRAIANALRRETFDAGADAMRPEPDALLASFGASRIVRFYEAVEAVLAPNQRPRVAQILREHSTYDPNAKGG